jgi:hypothetical protein
LPLKVLENQLHRKCRCHPTTTCTAHHPLFASRHAARGEVGALRCGLIYGGKRLEGGRGAGVCECVWGGRAVTTNDDEAKCPPPRAHTHVRTDIPFILAPPSPTAQGTSWPARTRIQSSQQSHLSPGSRRASRSWGYRATPTLTELRCWPLCLRTSLSCRLWPLYVCLRCLSVSFALSLSPPPLKSCG